MEAPSDGNRNPEEKEARKEQGTNSSTPETSSESINPSSQENTDLPRDSAQATLPPVAMEARDSRTSSIGTAHLSTSESQTSGYTTESSYETVIGYELLTESRSYAEHLAQSRSYAASIQTNYGPTNDLSEIHVPMDPASSEEDIQTVRRDLQDLLTNLVFHLRQGRNQAIYIIAYNYM